MSSTNCLDFLNNYADFLSANTDISGVRPHPVFFSEGDCAGSVWPPLANEPTINTSITNPASPYFGSVYVPVGWTVKLKGAEGTCTLTGANGLPQLLATTSLTTFDDTNTPITNKITSAEILQPTVVPNDPTSAPYTPADWKYDMCNNQIITIVGARHLTSWQMGSTECDAFMNSFCAPVSAQSCAANSTQPAPLPAKYQACICLVEENCLRDIFCEPNNTDPNCQQEDAFAEFIPVTCFGKLCSIEGYRFQRMQSQRCTITLCQQIIELIGQDIIVSGGDTIYCGNKSYALTSVSPSVSTSPSSTSSGIYLPLWAWVLIGIGVIVLFVAIPLAVIVYRRSRRRQAEIKQQAMNNLSGGGIKSSW